MDFLALGAVVLVLSIGGDGAVTGRPYEALSKPTSKPEPIYVQEARKTEDRDKAHRDELWIDPKSTVLEDDPLAFSFNSDQTVQIMTTRAAATNNIKQSSGGGPIGWIKTKWNGSFRDNKKPSTPKRSLSKSFSRTKSWLANFKRPTWLGGGQKAKPIGKAASRTLSQSTSPSGGGGSFSGRPRLTQEEKRAELERKTTEARAAGKTLSSSDLSHLQADLPAGLKNSMFQEATRQSKKAAPS